MNDTPNIENRAHTLFRASCDDIDDATLARLRRARVAALESPPTPLARRMLMPAGALAAAVLALVVAWPRHPAPNAPPAPVVATANGADNAVPDDDDVDLYNDLDFYTWLASQPSVASRRN